MPVRAKEFAVVMDAIPQKVLTRLKSASQEKDLNFQEIKSKILIGNTNIIQNILSNNYIRNILVMNLVATHYNCTSPMDSHHALHSHIPIHHYTNHTAVTIHSLALIVSPHLHLIHTHTFKQHSHMHSPRSLVLAPADISERYSSCYLCVWPRTARPWNSEPVPVTSTPAWYCLRLCSASDIPVLPTDHCLIDSV